MPLLVTTRVLLVQNHRANPLWGRKGWTGMIIEVHPEQDLSFDEGMYLIYWDPQVPATRGHSNDQRCNKVHASAVVAEAAVMHDPAWDSIVGVNTSQGYVSIGESESVVQSNDADLPF